MIRNIHESKPGSAWDDWQCEAAQWLADNPSATPEEINRAADRFGTDFVGLGNPSAAYGARRRAFMEGAAHA